jgi:hypothetical protein
MSTTHRFRRIASVVTCGVGLAAVTVFAQLSIGLTPGPWELRDGVGDPRPNIGPIVHVPFDDIQRRYHQIEPGQLDLRMSVNADCDGKGKQFVDLSLEVAGYPAALRVGVLGKKPGGGFVGHTSAATKAPIATTLKKLDVPDPVATCNKDLETFIAGRQHGKAQQGWARLYDRALPVTMNLRCQSEDKKKFGGFVDPGDISESSRTVQYPLWVHCRPAKVFQTTDGGKGKAPAHGAGVREARVWVNPKSDASYRGGCPKELRFGGSVEYTAGPGVDSAIRYRYRTHDNETSEVYTTHITGSDTKNLRSWERTFGAAGSRGSVAASGAGGKRVIDGWVKLEILDGNNIAAEDRAAFSLSCEPQRTKSEPPDATPVVATLSLPDLIIQSAIERDARTLSIQVANIGALPASPTSLQLFYHRSGQVMKKSFPVPTIAANQTAWILANVGSPLAAASQILLRVDDPSAVAEKDETNNGYKVK